MSLFGSLPPIITQPQDGQLLPVSQPQNLLVSWTPRHQASLNFAKGGVHYVVRLYELPTDNADINPNNITDLASYQVATVETTNPFYVFGPNDYPMQQGKRYVVQVQAVVGDGSEQIDNEGYSQVVSFQYGSIACSQVQNQAAAVETEGVMLSWETDNQADGYLVDYKADTAVLWQTTFTADTRLQLPKLPSGNYAYKITKRCGTTSSPASKAASFSIEAPESEPTDTDTTTYIADNPEPNPDVVGQGATPVEETAEDIIAAINTPVRIVVGDGTETLPVSSLPVLSPSTATPAQLLDAIKPKKPSCAGSGLAYDKCDISLPTYDASLPLITPNPGG